ncbi:excalibur calcium-binding domain-containing protein [Iodidimonas gelatinilytica]|uniref:excalibur calcium-binding domain-containing protein n=1 Tax=Iodidimonas gelatinilytica TaxID=1236966 RepID=UPI0012312E7B|nr:excalibur calcium-binding domain-containing protein [Iodidimonas gelatinilytica]
MKIHKFLIFTVMLLTFALSSTAFSHGGRLNAAGCHNDRKNGSYHCHRASRTSKETSPKKTDTTPSAAAISSNNRVFKNCSEARAAGAAPVFANDPRYGKHLDRDNDGIGCE